MALVSTSLRWPSLCAHLDLPDILSDGRDAELIAAAWLRRFGYPDAEATPPGPDDGVDVCSVGAVAQVKYWNTKNAGINTVQRVAGCAGPGQRAFFFSKSGYTKAATRWLNSPDCPVAAFVLHPTGDVAPANVTAIATIRRTETRIPSIERYPTSPWFRIPHSIGSLVSGALSTFILIVGVLHWTASADYFVMMTAMAVTLASSIFATRALKARQEAGRIFREIRSTRGTDRWHGWRHVLTRPVPLARDAGLPPDLFRGHYRTSGELVVSLVDWGEALGARLTKWLRLHRLRQRAQELL